MPGRRGARGYADHGPHEPRVVAAAWDGGAPSDTALAAAEDIARSTASALRVVRVHAPEYAAYPPALGADYAADVRTVREHARTALEDRVASLDTTVRAEAVLIEGDPADALVEISATADLLVMGSRGYGPLRAVLLGGVSGKVIRSAACPVIIIPNGAAIAVGSVFAARAQQTA